MDYSKEIKNQLNNIVNSAKDEIGGFRTNRPTTKIVEDVKVDYMGTPMTVKQLASISIEPPRDLIVAPWDRSLIPLIEQAIQAEKSGFSVSSQSGIVRVTMPELTTERKAEFVKLVKQAAENAKIKIRMTRDDFNRRLKDLKDEDERFRGKDAIQKEVDISNKAIDSLLEIKIREIEE